jgi:hypothetical protein
METRIKDSSTKRTLSDRSIVATAAVQCTGARRTKTCGKRKPNNTPLNIMAGLAYPGPLYSFIRSTAVLVVEETVDTEGGDIVNRSTKDVKGEGKVLLCSRIFWKLEEQDRAYFRIRQYRSGRIV